MPDKSILMRRLCDQSDAAGYSFAVIAALAICALLTIVSLIVPPSMYSDSGWGLLAWRSLLQGAPFNVVLSPDPDDIARDRADFLTWWSPGQYLVPGVLNLSGMSLGSALSLTVGLSLLVCLLGWIRFARFFELSPIVALLAVLFISTFRYTTLPFGIYTGGEILLQAATPWIFLYAYRIPTLSAYRAAAAAALILLIGFFVKLTGLIVVISALTASGLLTLISSRRITPGLVGGAVGASSAMVSLFFIWFSQGLTPASTFPNAFHLSHVVLALSAPWTAGFSWMDLLAWLFRHPARSLFDDGSTLIWFLPAIAIPVAALIVLSGKTDNSLQRLKLFTICVCATYTAFMLVLYFRGASVGTPDRHFRSVGTLVLVCALAVIFDPRTRKVSRYLFLAFCGFMSLYGLGSFAHRALSLANGDHLDKYSRTSQPLVAQAALDYTRAAYMREGGDSLFVLPSPDIAVAFPKGARIMSTHLDFQSEQEIAAMKYKGAVLGRLYVIMPSSIAAAEKGRIFLKAFSNYDFDGWETKIFGPTTVFFQKAPNRL